MTYVLRSSEDQTENTKTKISGLETGFREFKPKLEDIGVVSKD
ncbi:MAG: hypothetical protein ACI9KM_002977 [Rubritalea sp.]